MNEFTKYHEVALNAAAAILKGDGTPEAGHAVRFGGKMTDGRHVGIFAFDSPSEAEYNSVKDMLANAMTEYVTKRTKETGGTGAHVEGQFTNAETYFKDKEKRV